MLVLGGIALAWIVQQAFVPIETNRSSLLFQPNDRASLCIVGAAELQQPFEDVLGLSQYEADVWHRMRS